MRIYFNSNFEKQNLELKNIIKYVITDFQLFDEGNKLWESKWDNFLTASVVDRLAQPEIRDRKPVLLEPPSGRVAVLHGESANRNEARQNEKV